MFKNRLLI